MFIALDESIGDKYTTIGCLAVPLKNLFHYEHEFLNYRVRNKVWGEVKWNKCTETYLDKYIKFIELSLDDKETTFHSWTYQHPTSEVIRDYYDGNGDKVFYTHSYLLLRSVIRKILNQKYENNFYIVADTTGELGNDEYKITRDLLASDNYITPKPVLTFCDQGNSVATGAHQICDICTGATQYLYETKKSDPKTADKIVDLLKKINSNIEINYSSPRLPSLFNFKIHHCLYEARS